ncbi:MAG: hypothetical protein ABFS03_07020 [Chloroflexota bacterium]
MAKQPLFAGLVIDENDNPVETAYVGGEPFYVVDDNGFRRHIPSAQVDRKVLEMMSEMIEGHEDLLSEQAAKMLGQDDIFTRAMIEKQLKEMGEQYDRLLDQSIPEESRSYMGMAGFRIKINLHGDVIDLQQPGMITPDDE